VHIGGDLRLRAEHLPEIGKFRRRPIIGNGRGEFKGVEARAFRVFSGRPET